MYIKIKSSLIALLVLVLFAHNSIAADINATHETLEEILPIADTLARTITPRQQKAQLRREHRDSVRANKKVWTSVLGGPSYTPEASVGVAGAVLISFKTERTDSLLQRSFFPMGVNFSINGTLVVAGAGTLFFNENKFRIYSTYGLRNEPANYYGKGMDDITDNYRSDTTTLFHKQNIYLYNRVVWEVRPKFFLGPLFDITYSKSSDINPVMAADSYFNKYARRYTNIGAGAVVQYDTRNDVATPTSGLLFSAVGKAYGRYLGGDYNYEIVDLEYRQFQNLFRRATLAWTAHSTLSFGDVPFTELPSWGSPNDLRGFYWGEYRDKTMGYGLAEFRHMFGTQEDYKAGKLLSKFGYVVWAGAGTLGNTVADWKEWKYNYGAGLRVQIQPGKNFRLDIGKGQDEKGVLVYFNMTEAF